MHRTQYTQYTQHIVHTAQDERLLFFLFSSLLFFNVFNVRVVFLALHLHHTAPGDVKDVQETVTAGSVRNPHTVIDEGETVPPEKMGFFNSEKGVYLLFGERPQCVRTEVECVCT